MICLACLYPLAATNRPTHNPCRGNMLGKRHRRLTQERPLATGTVKFFNTQKGFGFIVPDDGGQDLFVHRSNVETADQTLSDNQKVEFVVGQGRKGPEAQQVRPL